MIDAQQAQIRAKQMQQHIQTQQAQQRQRQAVMNANSTNPANQPQMSLLQQPVGQPATPLPRPGSTAPQQMTQPGMPTQATLQQAVQSLTNTYNTPNPLLDLPPEMRNEIYRAALTIGTERYDEGNLICFGDYKTPALLQVCHQIRDEASGIYYGENTFFHLGFFKFEPCYGCMQYGKGRVRYVDQQVRKATGEGISLLSGFKVMEWELQEG